MTIDMSAIQDKIGEVEYFHSGALTICVIRADNGFCTIGHSAPVDVTEYDEEVGKQCAYQEAFEKLVDHEVYYMRETAFVEELVDEMFGSDIPDPDAPDTVAEYLNQLPCDTD